MAPRITGILIASVLGLGVGYFFGYHASSKPKMMSAADIQEADRAMEALSHPTADQQMDDQLSIVAAKANTTTWPLMKAGGIRGATMLCFLKLNQNPSATGFGAMGWAMTLADERGHIKGDGHLVGDESIDKQVRERFAADLPVPVVVQIENDLRGGGGFLMRNPKWVTFTNGVATY